MRARHHTARPKAVKGHLEAHRAEGGPVPNVIKEAKGKSIGHIEGEKPKMRLDRKRGGRCVASGGRTGSDKSPYTSAREGHAGAIPEEHHDDHEGSRHGLSHGGKAHVTDGEHAAHHKKPVAHARRAA